MDGEDVSVNTAFCMVCSRCSNCKTIRIGGGYLILDGNSDGSDTGRGIAM